MAENLTAMWQGGSWSGRGRWRAFDAAGGFGGTREEIEGLVKMGPQKAVASVMEYKRVKDDLAGVEFGELSGRG